MECTLTKRLLLVLLLAVVVVKLRGEQVSNGTAVKDQSNVTSSNEAQPSQGNGSRNVVAVDNKGRSNGAGGFIWGWGGGGGGGGGGDRGGGGGGGGGGWGWGWGSSGGGYWRWGCWKPRGKRGHHLHNGEYRMGEYAQCMVIGRCRGMRLDCPLHCGGPCFYDCTHNCKAHCRR